MSFDSPIRFEPLLLLSLVVLAGAVGLWLLAERRRMRYAVRYPNIDVLATVVQGRSWPRLVPPVIFGLALALLLVSLARPHVDRMFLTERATVILVVDTSRSMQAKDVKPTRLAAAQQAIREFLDQVPSRLNVGLIVFAGEAQVATPPTKDRELVETAVDSIDTYVIFGGTAIGDALETAVDLGKKTIEQEDPPEGEEIAAGSTRLDRRTRPARRAGRSRSSSSRTARRRAGSSSRSRAPRSRVTRASPCTRSRSGRPRASSTAAASAPASARRTTPARASSPCRPTRRPCARSRR